jgi:hypothetical protein
MKKNIKWKVDEKKVKKTNIEDKTGLRNKVEIVVKLVVVYVNGRGGLTVIISASIGRCL